VSRWRVERITGSAGGLHALEPPDPVTRTAWVFAVERAALVLGSTQSDSIVDHVAADSLGADIVRRRSGGGAVWLDPGGTVWVDVLLPRGDPLWDDDVGRAAHWLGEVWAAAIADNPNATGDVPQVHRDGMVCSSMSGRVCFAGLGPGEVTVGGRKAVGISQRRTRAGARFQCVAYERWDAGPLLATLELPEGAAAGLATAGADLGIRRESVEEAFLHALP
jgi:lipoate-protein ligase A